MSSATFAGCIFRITTWIEEEGWVALRLAVEIFVRSFGYDKAREEEKEEDDKPRG